jgi:hypothetical protein
VRMRFTRRRLVQAMAGSAAVAAAQTQPAPPATPDDELKAARDRLQANAATIQRQEVPMAVEPAFQFKA